MHRSRRLLKKKKKRLSNNNYYQFIPTVFGVNTRVTRPLRNILRSAKLLFSNTRQVYKILLCVQRIQVLQVRNKHSTIIRTSMCFAKKPITTTIIRFFFTRDRSVFALYNCVYTCAVVRYTSDPKPNNLACESNIIR